MRKSIFLTLLCLLGMGAMQTAQAAYEIYGVLSEDGKTFTILCDEDKTTNKGVTPDDWMAYEWMEKRWNIETVVIDASMVYINRNGILYDAAGNQVQ